MYIFEEHATEHMRLEKSDRVDDRVISDLGNRIRTELNEQKDPDYLSYYKTDIKETYKFQSPTLTRLMGIIFKRRNTFSVEDDLVSLLISNIMFSVVTKQYTPLQISLAILLKKSEFVTETNKYRITCTIDELQRLKSSIAINITKQPNSYTVSAPSNLLQFVVDNYDAVISSQNGLKSTHSLGIIAAVTDLSHSNMQSYTEEVIERISWKEHKQLSIVNDMFIDQYHGPTKPSMPTYEHHDLPEQLELESKQMVNYSTSVDFMFLEDIGKSSETKLTPEYNGYNNKLALESGRSIKNKTQVWFKPMIDMRPSDPSCIKTAMMLAVRETQESGQQYTVFTADQQLYKVAVDVSWVYPNLFPKTKFIIRLGGMHLLMNFLGCVGKLMTNTGLEEVLSCAFGSVKKMLIGKYFPQNIRALRMVLEELISPILQTVTSYDGLTARLKEMRAISNTAKVWVDAFVSPMLTVLLYIRAEKEGEWLLHLQAVKQMLPYFFAAGHHNYARYATNYLNDMYGLPEEVHQKFMKGLHVARLKSGFFNGIWSDMLIETTYMKFGKSFGGLVGITLKPKSVLRWAYSFHKLSSMIKDLKEIDDKSSSTWKHKEEYSGRMKSDLKDRSKIQRKLAGCIEPFNETGGDFSTGVVNIASGKVTPNSQTNIYDCIKVGREQLIEFRSSLPDGFNEKIPSRVKLATTKIRKIKSSDGSRETSNVGSIFNRLLIIRETSDNPITMVDVLRYELTPMPLSMFEMDGTPRIIKKKSDIMNSIKAVVATRGRKHDVSILDGCAILWKIQWPTSSGTMKDYIKGFVNYITDFLKRNDVVLIFDRYYDYSIKSVIRENRNVTQSSKQVKITMDGPAHEKNIVLTNKGNKKQLINLLVNSLKYINISKANRKLVVTGPDPVPFELTINGLVFRDDLKTFHEEADTIIVSQMLSMVGEGYKRIQVICEDSDVFLLLLYHYQENELQGKDIDILMHYPVTSIKATSIPNTVESLSPKLISSLLSAHALSGCDTVPQLYGIGKKTAIKLLKTQNHDGIELLGNVDPNIPWETIERSCVKFICKLYGEKDGRTLADMRYSKWIEKCKVNKMTSASSLKWFPPTLEAARLNIQRAHFQCFIWRNLKMETAVTLEPENYGWTKDTANKSLEILCLDPITPIAPDVLMKITFCGCSSAEPCKTQNCGCRKNTIKCSALCKCTGTCCNGNRESSIDALSSIDGFLHEEDSEGDEQPEDYTDDDDDDN